MPETGSSPGGQQVFVYGHVGVAVQLKTAGLVVGGNGLTGGVLALASHGWMPNAHGAFTLSLLCTVKVSVRPFSSSA